ncbi:hypothetical protein GCM10027074_63790 [Streptomyces deserti]
MTDGIAWLAAPRSIAFGGYSVVMARDLAGEEVARRVAGTALGPRRSARFIGHLTGTQLNDVLEGVCGDVRDGLALRHGEIDEWGFAVKYGGWFTEFGDQTPVSRGGAHVFHLEYQEENFKPVPPNFAYFHDERLMCALNLHLDRSWAYGSAEGDAEVARRVEDMLAAAGLLDETMARRAVHRASLEVLEQCFGLTLPRRQIVEETLPAVFLRRD